MPNLKSSSSDVHSCFISLPYPFCSLNANRSLCTPFSVMKSYYFWINPAISLCSETRWQWRQITFEVSFTIPHPEVYSKSFLSLCVDSVQVSTGWQLLPAVFILLGSVSPGEAMTETRPDGAGERGRAGLSDPDNCTTFKVSENSSNRKEKPQVRSLKYLSQLLALRLNGETFLKSLLQSFRIDPNNVTHILWHCSLQRFQYKLKPYSFTLRLCYKWYPATVTLYDYW